MDTFEFKPTEGFTLAKATAGGETEALAGATFEPAAFVEGIGEVQPAEALQVSLEAVVASLPTEVDNNPPAVPMELTAVPVASGEPDYGMGHGDPYTNEYEPPKPGETKIEDIPGGGAIPGIHGAETIVKDLPPREEEKPTPMQVEMEEAVTKPPSEVIVEVACPWVQFLGMKQAEKANRRSRMTPGSGGQLPPQPSGRNLELKLPSQPTYLEQRRGPG